MRSPIEGTDRLAEICYQKGIRSLVISPGSRNAPIIRSFTQNKGIECLSIVDERSAAYFALGMAQQTGKTVALACTSGTALLNFAPAIAEAYYQKIPLLILTADRPAEWIDQSDNQTIRQQNIYSNYIKKSFHLPQDISDPDSLWYYERSINEAINLCDLSSKGPVHVNIPLKEPLYAKSLTEKFSPQIIESLSVEKKIDPKVMNELRNQWSKAKGKMILAGMLPHDEELKKSLLVMSQDPDVVILTESTSNLVSENIFDRFDLILTSAGDELPLLKPEILITIGNNIISKKIKQFLRKYKPQSHWHIEENDVFPDTFQSLKRNIPIPPAIFFRDFTDSYTPGAKSSYSQKFKKLAVEAKQKHERFLKHCDFSDLKVFDTLLKAIPKGSILQLGNSSPVRYAQYFPADPSLKYNSNRGTSGIDGTVSTAAGAAFVSESPVTIIVGDIAFFYDSNALWNSHLKENFRIILINNGGGGIFRLIEGPEDTMVLEEYFETKHDTSAKGICQSYKLKYFTANNQDELNRLLPEFYSSTNNQTSLLEIFTPAQKNAEIFKSYFSFLKTST